MELYSEVVELPQEMPIFFLCFIVLFMLCCFQNAPVYSCI